MERGAAIKDFAEHLDPLSKEKSDKKGRKVASAPSVPREERKNHNKQVSKQHGRLFLSMFGSVNN
jgi:hypothetical protein